jgi:hypothetical protein
MEKEVLKETIREINPNSEKSLKKIGYKYKKKKETNFDLKIRKSLLTIKKLIYKSTSFRDL